MLSANIRLLLVGAGLLSATQAHTVFTTLYVNGITHGDGVSVRMNMDPSHVVDYIQNITSNDMACGKLGLDPRGDPYG